MSVQGATALIVAIAGLVTATGSIIALLIHTRNASGEQPPPATPTPPPPQPPR
jgi:hypothetical protein